MANENNYMALLYFITFILFICWYYRQKYCVTKTNNIEISNHSNEIQLDDGGYLPRTNNDQQRCLVPLNVVNSLEYENIYNPLHEQPRSQYNAGQTSRINISTTRATISPFSSSLNYVELHSSNVASFSRSLLNDPPPPSYDECMASSQPTSHTVNLTVN